MVLLGVLFAQSEVQVDGMGLPRGETSLKSPTQTNPGLWLLAGSKSCLVDSKEETSQYVNPSLSTSS